MFLVFSHFYAYAQVGPPGTVMVSQSVMVSLHIYLALVKGLVSAKRYFVYLYIKLKM